MAENTGRSGQPVQNVGGRAGSGAAQRLVDLGALRLDRGDPLLERRRRDAHSWRRNAARPLPTTSGVYSPAIGSTSLPCSLVLQVGLAQDLADRLLDEVGRALLDDQHGLLAGAEAGDLLGHQRMHDVEHQRRQPPRRRTTSLRPAQREPAVEHVEQAALHDDADVAVGRPQPLVELVVDDELLRRRQPPRRPCRPPGGRSPADGSAARS